MHRNLLRNVVRLALAAATLAATAGVAAAGGTAAGTGATPIARVVHLQVTDPGDPAGGIALDTSLLGEHACTTVTLDDRTTRRKVELCASGTAERPLLELRLERGGAAGAVDLRFAAVAPRGQRTRLGKVALDAHRAIEAHATIAASP